MGFGFAYDGTEEQDIQLEMDIQIESSWVYIRANVQCRRLFIEAIPKEMKGVFLLSLETFQGLTIQGCSFFGLVTLSGQFWFEIIGGQPTYSGTLLRRPKSISGRLSSRLSLKSDTTRFVCHVGSWN